MNSLSALPAPAVARPLPSVPGPALTASPLAAALRSPGGAAATTGAVLDGARRRRTGVVGAVAGGLLRGLSNLAPIPTSPGRLASLIRKGGATALSLATRGAKKAGALAKVAGRHVVSAGRSVGDFLNSPAGMLASTALSLAVTFIPGGIFLKAGIGAIAGAVEAVAKGGGLKQALMGAAAGAVEGVIPVAKLGALAKLALGSGKGALFAAADGGDLRSVVTGALGGAVGASGAAMRARRLSKAGGLQKIDSVLRGSRKHRGALGRLQKAVGTRRGRQLYRTAQRQARRSIRGAAWMVDRSGSTIRAFQNTRLFLDVGQGATDAVEWLASTGAERFADGRLKRLLLNVTSSAQVLGHQFDKADDTALQLTLHAERLNKQLPLAISLLGDHANAGKAIRLRRQQDRRRQRIQRQQRKERDSKRRRKTSKRARRDLQSRDLFARIDDFAHHSVHRVDRLRHDLSRRLRRAPVVSRIAPQTSALRARLQRWEHGIRSHGPLIQKSFRQGYETTKQARDVLRSAVLAMEAEDSQVAPSLTWLHEFAVKWEQRLDKTHQVLRAGYGITATAQGALDLFPDASPADRQALNEKRREAQVLWGQVPPSRPTDRVGGVASAGQRAQRKAAEVQERFSNSPFGNTLKESTTVARLQSAHRVFSDRMTEIADRQIVEFPDDPSAHHPHAAHRGLSHLAGMEVHEAYRVRDWRAREQRQASRERWDAASTFLEEPEPSVEPVSSKVQETSPESDRPDRRTPVGGIRTGRLDPGFTDAMRQALESSAPSETVDPATTPPFSLAHRLHRKATDDAKRFDEVPTDKSSQSLYALLARYSRAVPLGRTREDDDTLNAWEEELEARIEAAFASGIEEVVEFALECAEALRLLRERRAANAELDAAYQRGELERRGIHISQTPPSLLLLPPSGAPSPTPFGEGEDASPVPENDDGHMGEAAAARPIRSTAMDRESMAGNGPHQSAADSDPEFSPMWGDLPDSPWEFGPDVVPHHSGERPARDPGAPDDGHESSLLSPDSTPLPPPPTPSTASDRPPFGRAVGRLLESSRRRRSLMSGAAPRVRVALDRPGTLDLAVLSRMERFLGERLPRVHIHTGRAAARLTRRLDADAATVGTHVFFAPGRYQPDTTEGQRLIAHELTHVLQRNRPNLDVRTAEREAHEAEARFEAAAPHPELVELKPLNGTAGPEFSKTTIPTEQMGMGKTGSALAARRNRRSSLHDSLEETFDLEALIDEMTEKTAELLAQAARDERLG